MTYQAQIVFPPLRRYKPAWNLRKSVFLGGSIEMGECIDWQADATERLLHSASVIYNPRRSDWNADAKQSIDDPYFNGQVHWELDMIKEADLVLFNLVAETKSPISLMEIGICSELKPSQTLVACPPSFWRHGNVEIVCERSRMMLFDSYETMMDEVSRRM